MDEHQVKIRLKALGLLAVVPEGRRLENGVADRRLEALLEEERTRAASVPVAGVRRLRLEDGRDQTRALDDGGREAAGRGAQGGPIGTLDDGARAMGLGQRQGGPMEALDDPRARSSHGAWPTSRCGPAVL